MIVIGAGVIGTELVNILINEDEFSKTKVYLERKRKKVSEFSLPLKAQMTIQSKISLNCWIINVTVSREVCGNG